MYKVRVPFCCVNELSAFHTNESILKCVVELEDVKRTGGLNKIIALVSRDALNKKDERYANQTAVSYYSHQAKELCSNIEIVLVDIEDCNKQGRDISVILSDICKNIHTNDVVFIDSAGGLRTINNVVQILTKLLKYKGIKNPCTLYSDIQNVNSFITDTSSFTKMTDLADAFNEFMTTGKADQLGECFVDANTESPFRGLIDAMIEFSDKIRLGNVKDIDYVMKKLTSQVDICKSTFVPDSIEGVIFMQFLPVIESKIVGSSVNGIDYVKIINWCLENMLIQQALTLFVEKLPIYVFENGMIQCNFNTKEAKREHESAAEKNKTIPKDWETFVFYSECLEGNNFREVANKEIEEFICCLKGNRQPRTKHIVTALSVIYSYRKKYPKSNVSHKAKILLDDFIDNEKVTTDYESFVNIVCKDKSFVKKYLSFFSCIDDKKDGDKTLNKKFESVRYLELNGFKNPKYSYSVRREKLIAMYYAYIYAKALRNQINHASSDENLVDWQIDILSKQGYDCSRFDMRALRKNLEFALGHFVVEESAENVGIASQMVFEPTSLQVGNKVEAEYLGNKKVRLKNVAYEVQLICPKWKKLPEFIGDIVNVYVKQISSTGKIIQVELI